MTRHTLDQRFRVDSPLGPLGIITTDKGLREIAFDATDERFEAREPVTALEKEIVRCLERYFEGEPEDFGTIPIDIGHGTSFQRSIWKSLCSIPYGRVESYRWLSARAGHRKAYRAAGQANRRNPIPIVIPCHRVVNANGSLGGFQGLRGLDKKRFLLTLEGRAPDQLLPNKEQQVTD